MTATQRRRHARAAYDAYLAACPTRRLLDILGDKWASPALRALADGPRRHSEIGRTLAGASQKMLTQTLRSLERDGLVSRTVTASVPARVDYALTDLGRGLLPVIAAIQAWADEHDAEILRARARHDAEPGGDQPQTLPSRWVSTV